MKFEVSILLACLLVSCEKPTPISNQQPEPAPEINSSLAGAQFQLAISHLGNGLPEESIPYLEASLKNDPSERTRKILANVLAENQFEIPTYRLDHPSYVTTFVEGSGSLFVAIGAPHPTVVRWDLGGTPEVSAILFPSNSGASPIGFLALSPSEKHILVHRRETNLLCDAETLKPITNLGTFPDDLNPGFLQPFSSNSLLLAHPTRTGQNIIWHIRDAATGETLRSESFPHYPVPELATFDNTKLVIVLEDSSEIHLPIVGDVSKKPVSEWDFSNSPPSHPSNIFIEGNSLTHRLPIPYTPDSKVDLRILTGYHLNPTTQELEEIPTPNRLATLSETFPEIPPTFSIYTSETAVQNRLAAAFPEEFPALTAAPRAHAEIIRQIFATGDPAAITAAIRALPPTGLPTATALFLSLKSENPGYLRETLAIAENVPAPLRSPDIPVRTNYREEQDWLGYESPDFSEIFTQRENEKKALVSELQLPPDPTGQDIQSFINHLLSPETQQRLPRETLALSAITAARTLMGDQAQATSALQLTALAERLGTPHPEVLRTRATAFTSLADFTSAHRTWIDLITNEPEATHLPTDYSEAAYTAFETSAPDQAAEILETGLFRFPEDVALAIRAGWIALLTDHPDKAVEYLTHATTLGLPPAEIENTTALLAIAHTLLGDPETATAYFDQLQAIDPTWADPETIESLPWPEPLKAPLRQLTW